MNHQTNVDCYVKLLKLRFSALKRTILSYLKLTITIKLFELAKCVVNKLNLHHVRFDFRYYFEGT